MPIYEYACNNCDHRLDALQRMSDEPLTDCPECGEPQLKRLISAPRFRLKGGGWYETDFKTGNQRNVLKSDSEGDKGAGKADKTDKAAQADSGGAGGSGDKQEKKTSPATKSGGSASD